VKKANTGKKNVKNKNLTILKSASENKKTVSEEKTAEKKKTSYKITEKNTTVKKPEKPAFIERPATVQSHRLGLPEGSEIQITGHRRPLIVFPK